MHTTTRGRPLRAITLAGTILTVTAATAAAQSLGFRAGVNHGSVDFETVPAGMSVGYATSWHAGAYVEMPVASLVSVVAEARYANRGWTLGGATTDADATASYIEVPLLAKIGSSAARPITPHLFAGPVLSFRVACDVSGDVAGVELDGSCAQSGVDIKDQDLGIMVGAGLDLEYVGWTLVVDLAYDQGLLNVSDIGGSARSRAFLLSLGFEAPFGT